MRARLQPHAVRREAVLLALRATSDDSPPVLRANASPESPICWRASSASWRPGTLGTRARLRGQSLPLAALDRLASRPSRWPAPWRTLRLAGLHVAGGFFVLLYFLRFRGGAPTVSAR